jgi:hypothetical protein
LAECEHLLELVDHEQQIRRVRFKVGQTYGQLRGRTFAWGHENRRPVPTNGGLRSGCGVEGWEQTRAQQG